VNQPVSPTTGKQQSTGHAPGELSPDAHGPVSAPVALTAPPSERTPPHLSEVVWTLHQDKAAYEALLRLIFGNVVPDVAGGARHRQEYR
jgi:hypothetical protein